MTDTGKVAVLTVIIVGVLYWMLIAWQQRKHSWKIDGFFLGGRNIGAQATTQVFWGTSFSLANGIYYFAVLGYYYGLSVIWLQLPWIGALFYLAWKLPSIMRETGKQTLHGFLGSVYGDGARWIASLVTITGFLGVFAFEVNVSVEIITRSFGVPNLTIPITLFGVLIVAAYCDIGGFRGNSRTDGPQNLMGTIAAILLVFLIFRVPNLGIKAENLNTREIAESLFSIWSLPPAVVIGILCFASTANIVDMSNWQTIAANSAESEADIRKLRSAILLSTPRIFLFPAVVGTFFGYVWRGIEVKNDQELISQLLAQVMPQADFVGGIILGLVVLGLAATSFSTADSYLVSCVQAWSWDLVDHKRIKAVSSVNEIPDREQHEIVERSRRMLYVMAIISTVGFLLLRKALGDTTVFAAQFAIFGAITALFPATVLGLRARDAEVEADKCAKCLGFLSILMGYLACLVVFIWFLVKSKNSAQSGEQAFNVYAWAPTATLAVSGIFGLFLFLRLALWPQTKKN